MNEIEPSGWLEQDLFWAGSKLTDPICYAHENFRRIQLVDTLYEDRSLLFRLAEKTVLFTRLIGYASLALITTPFGVAFRAIATQLQERPFIHISNENTSKEIPSDLKFTLFSWNICGVGGGYPISDGGVSPWRDRIDAILQTILQVDADVNCIYETFDTESAFYLVEKLKEHGYVDFDFNMGAQAIGSSSGIFIASKYKIANPEFTRFPEDMLIGRTKYCSKGIFKFEMLSQNKKIATVLATHLQHSEEPAFPTLEERLARESEMRLIVQKVSDVADGCVVITGDLNLDTDELNTSSWKMLFEKDDSCSLVKTWGGDGFCARLVGNKRISGPLDLDHTLIAKASAKMIRSKIIDAGFNGSIYNPNSTSDHDGILSTITLQDRQISHLAAGAA